MLQAAAIDSLAYTISDDHTTMTVDVSAHGGPENLYYRWIAEETWEYHAPFQASHFFVPRNTYLKGKLVERDTVAMYEDGENTYYCWNHGQVSDLMIASAKDLTENRITDITPILSLPRLEQLQLGANKIDSIYGIERLEGLKTLWLNSDQLTDIVPISRLTMLETLHLENNPGLIDLSPLYELPSLHSVWLSGCGVTDEDVMELRYMQPDCAVIY